MRVYLAAPYATRSLVREYAAELERIGFTISATWLNETHAIDAGTLDAAPALSDDAIAKHALDDLIDVGRSDVLVVFTAEAVGMAPATAASGGRHVETGYAIGLKLPVLVVGEPENVFHRLGTGQVLVVPSWHEAVIELSSRLVRLTADRDIVAAPVR